ncbi:retropepsin-like aspartic protease family protein [Comamonas composti]|uniref:retropepsin-like aspartic protease family protein n=1 Tax=Comamonas composti TaxID=408558 RepID=UPI00047AE2AB|nr:retropepsin-like aspartic protease [Comamonas composti]
MPLKTTAHRRPRSDSGEPSPQSVARRATVGFLLFWLLVMGVLYWAMQLYLQPARATVQADGSLVIARDRDGHFRVDGAINGESVRFLVDTGATAISVTDGLAQRAGLVGGERVRFRTANGEREGRMVVAQQVRVANLVVSGLSVGTGYTGDSEGDALLGQNFLRQFDVQMRADSMLIQPRGSLGQAPR